MHADRTQIEQLGGAKWIVITNRDHEREAASFQEWTNAEVCEYPDSKKVLPFAVREIYRKGESLNYFDGE